MRGSVRVAGFVIPVTVDDLAANGLLGEARSAGVLGALGRDPHGKEGRHRRTRRRLRRANRGLPPLREARSGGETEIVSLRSFIEDGGARLKQLLSRLRARGMGTFRFPKVHPAEISKELPGDARFPPRRRASTLRSEARGPPGATKLACPKANAEPRRASHRPLRVAQRSHANGAKSVRPGSTV